MNAPEDFDRLGELLSDFCEAAAAPGVPDASPGDTARALAAVWSEVAGAEVASNASPVQFKAGRLVVSTSSSVWADTLQYMSADLVSRLNQRLGPGTVRQILFRHAGWEERPAGERTSAPAGEGAGAERLSREQEEALAGLDELDLPGAMRDSVARAMRASFVRSKRDSVR